MVITHDGTLDSCDRVRQWARQHGWQVMSIVNLTGAADGFTVSLVSASGARLELSQGDAAWATGQLANTSTLLALALNLSCFSRQKLVSYAPDIRQRMTGGNARQPAADPITC